MDPVSVRAILAGMKCETRRVLTPQPQHLQVYHHRGELLYDAEHRMWCFGGLVVDNIWDFPGNDDRKEVAELCPFGQPGDRLWVKEDWAASKFSPPKSRSTKDAASWRAHYVYRADCRDGADTPPPDVDRWQSSRFMPQAACRLILGITEVRLERLREIDRETGHRVAEGFGHAFGGGAGSVLPYADFQSYWDDCHDKRGHRWVDDPFVWAIRFERCR